MHGSSYPYCGYGGKDPWVAHGEEKCVICNGDEGDPGAFKDRSVMEGASHYSYAGELSS